MCLYTQSSLHRNGSIKPSFYRTLTKDLSNTELALIIVLNTGIVNQSSILNFSVE